VRTVESRRRSIILETGATTKAERKVAHRRTGAFSWAMAIVAAALGVMFVGATLPTPLYPIYRSSFEFGKLTLTLIYAIYVLGNLAALLLFGRLSDQVGRRLVTLPALGIGVLSVVTFIFAVGVSWLLAARVLSGLATGLVSGAATAWIAELQPQHDRAVAAVTASGANFMGLAVGSLLAGTLADQAPLPLRLSYIVYLGLLLAVGVALVFPRETVASRASHWRDLALRPRLGVPAGIRLSFMSPAATAFATLALLGFYAALIPGVLVESLHQSRPLVAGAVVFALFLVATATTVLTGNVASRNAMLGGLALLPPALALLVGAEVTRSMLLLVTAAVVGGVASALSYRGSLEVVNRISPADRRSEVVSSYLVAVYAGNSLPVIGIGILSGLASSGVAHVTFAVVIAALAAVAFFVGVKYAREP
jgi:predicted MFS family arabinose efflux permease